MSETERKEHVAGFVWEEVPEVWDLLSGVQAQQNRYPRGILYGTGNMCVEWSVSGVEVFRITEKGYYGA